MAKRVDRNQAEIIRALKSCGATVQSLHELGQGCPDLLVGYRGANLLFEIKDGDKSPSRRTLTVAQVWWHEAWRGKVFVVSSPTEAVSTLQRAVAYADS